MPVHHPYIGHQRDLQHDTNLMHSKEKHLHSRKHPATLDGPWRPLKNTTHVSTYQSPIQIIIHVTYTSELYNMQVHILDLSPQRQPMHHVHIQNQLGGKPPIDMDSEKKGIHAIPRNP
jgi:hypothetical protein